MSEFVRFIVFLILQANCCVPAEAQRRPSLPIKSINYSNKITGPVESLSSIKSATFSDFKEIIEETEINSIILNHSSSKSRYHEYNNPSVKFSISSYQEISKDTDNEALETTSYKGQKYLEE